MPHPPAMHQAKFLLVGEAPASLAELVDWVVSYHAQPLVADNAAEAEAALAHESVDLILCDAHLESATPLDWVRQLLTREDAPPVILIATQIDPANTFAALQLPISGYFVRPLDFGALEKRCSALLGEQRRLQGLRDLAHVTRTLLGSGSGQGLDEVWRDHLTQFTEQVLTLTRARRPGPVALDQHWREAIAEAIGVLEHTRTAFRARDVSYLHRRVPPTAPPPPERPTKN